MTTAPKNMNDAKAMYGAPLYRVVIMPGGQEGPN